MKDTRPIPTVVCTFFDYPSRLLKALHENNVIRLIRPPIANLAPVQHRQWLKENVKHASALIVWIVSGRIDEEILREAHDSLKVISVFGVGYDHIDMAYCKSRNILVGTTPNVSDDAVANEALLILLMVLRRSAESQRLVKTGNFPDMVWGTGSDPHYLCGQSVMNKTVALYGFGRIAQKIAERLLPLGPRRILYKTSRVSAPLTASSYPTLYQLASTIYKGCQFEHRSTIKELVQEADVVICITPLTEETRSSINEETLCYFKQGSYIVNVGRGAVIETEALIKVLRQGKLAGAALDVLNEEPNVPSSHPLLADDIADKVVIFPHVASAEMDSRTAQSELVARNVFRGLGLSNDDLVGCIRDENEKRNLLELIDGETHFV